MSSHCWGRFGAFVRPCPIQRKVVYLSSMLSLADGVNPAWELSHELTELSTVPDTGELSPKTICKETHSTEPGAGGLGAAGRAAACPAHPHSPTRWAWRGGGCLLCTDCQGSPSPVQVPTALKFGPATFGTAGIASRASSLGAVLFHLRWSPGQRALARSTSFQACDPALYCVVVTITIIALSS